MKTLVFFALLCAGAVHADEFYTLRPLEVALSGTVSLVHTGIYIYGSDEILHCDSEPVVKKEGDGWVITFKPKANK